MNSRITVGGLPISKIASSCQGCSLGLETVSRPIFARLYRLGLIIFLAIIALNFIQVMTPEHERR